ncbi:hypothetical protein HGRIS_008370 [Hohenbuehelia grisea]|uniref:beta-galactosidase n=1 Tax=Hohenbuehelia grisea TaxID=104357 RepID=A0ABR3J7R0_9AGAR
MQVDNEFSQTPDIHAGYFADLETVYHDSPIEVPLTYNDPFQSGSFVNGTGAVDLYGLDSYPQGSFNCTAPSAWRPVVTNYHQYHQSVNPSQPWYIPEFQSGVLDVWGPLSPGYAPCLVKTGADYLSVFNLQLWASNAKLINYYMFYGGTSWGALPYPAAYTSYDYGASISEPRLLTSKFDEMKRQGLFLRSSPEFYKTDWVTDSSSGGVFTTSTAAFVTFLQNPDTHAGFYVLRQTDSTSTAVIDFKLNVTTSIGPLEIPAIVPSITLGGRQSKVILTDYAFGSSRLLYSTASIFFAGNIGGRDVLFLYGDATQQYETSLVLKGSPHRSHSLPSSVNFTSSAKGRTVISFHSGIQGLITVYDSIEQLILFADTVTAATFWAPTIADSTNSPFKNYWSIGTNATILVGGPYLVRGASISDGHLALRGDLNSSVTLSVVAPHDVRSISWNGKPVKVNARDSAALTFQGGLVGTLQATMPDIHIPKLGGWKFADSLPEIRSDFSDSKWVVANHTTTNCPRKPYYGDGRVLYGCDYGFCESVVLWRGHINATGSEKSMNLSINGGQGFAASVWLNDVFLNTSFGNSSANHNVLEETDDKFTFPLGALRAGKDNVVTVVQDNMGMNETGLSPTSNDPKSPRGIRGFQLEGGNFSDWKVQGKIGGYTNYPDKFRGVLNEGGLFGERKGWHLPGFDVSRWIKRDLASGLPNSAAGVGFFVTTFDLRIPAGLDVALSFTFQEPLGQPYRAYLFVNGWMMGKRIGNLGPQSKFPVQEGILDYSGKNTVAVALWAMVPNVTISPSLQLTLDHVIEGGMGKVQVENPKWSAVGRE